MDYLVMFDTILRQYLNTLPADDGDDYGDSDRRHAERVFDSFHTWYATQPHTVPDLFGMIPDWRSRLDPRIERAVQHAERYALHHAASAGWEKTDAMAITALAAMLDQSSEAVRVTSALVQALLQALPSDALLDNLKHQILRASDRAYQALYWPTPDDDDV